MATMAGVGLPHGRMTKWDRREGVSQVLGGVGLLLRASSHLQKTGEAIGSDWTARRGERDDEGQVAEGWWRLELGLSAGTTYSEQGGLSADP